MEANELSEFETVPVLNAVSQLNLGPCHLDIGRLAVAYFDKGAGEGLSVEEYVAQELAYLVGSTHKPVEEPVDVVLYGFGRIGRLMARILIAKTDGGDSLRLRAVVVRKGKADDDLLKRASLLRRDSVHGTFQGTIRVDEERQSFVATFEGEDLDASLLLLQEIGFVDASDPRFVATVEAIEGELSTVVRHDEDPPVGDVLSAVGPDAKVVRIQGPGEAQRPLRRPEIQSPRIEARRVYGSRCSEVLTVRL